MIIQTQRQAPRYERDGTTSYLLVSPLTCGSLHLTTSIVEMEPDGLQRPHRHEPEQIYFIISGSGLMSVLNETWEVKEGDCVLVPPGSVHSLRNTGETTLRYFSAAAPAFSAEQLEVLWPLRPEGDVEEEE
jgi:mannose-6-phosphate isomerase-like protein (cupin superfamily)